MPLVNYELVEENKSSSRTAVTLNAAVKCALYGLAFGATSSHTHVHRRLLRGYFKPPDFLSSITIHTVAVKTPPSNFSKEEEHFRNYDFLLFAECKFAFPST